MITQVPSVLLEKLTMLLNAKAGSPVTLQDFSFVGGGCINHGGVLEASSGKFFLKWNSATRFPGMFGAEARGLGLLSEANVLRVPTVIGFDEANEYQFLVMEYIEQNGRSPLYWEHLGQGLAALHRVSSGHLGLDHNNYIGSLPQFNASRSSWVDFFIQQRLQVQVQLMNENGMADGTLLNRFERLYKKLPSLLPEEKPSLLHGDLWSGNLITDEKGEPCIIDPAVYYGHREADLAMTRLFGSFEEAFYRSYHEAFPLLKGYEQRFDLYNLYPLLVHVNLFGSAYISQVKTILHQFTS